MPRQYPNKDLKLLWGLSAARCAFPGCRRELVIRATPTDPAGTVGVIAHIYAHSSEGPRANPGLTPEQRDCYDNWILLCGYHHDMVDVQPNTYRATDLTRWKAEHEQWVRDRLAEELPEVTFAELEIAAKGIIGSSMPSSSFEVIDPARKMKRNNLTDRVRLWIVMGQGASMEVQGFIEHVSQYYPDYAARLRGGFVAEYNRLRDVGFDGDDLFEALRDFAGGRSHDFRRQAAGLAVLGYLFGKCEVFEHDLSE